MSAESETAVVPATDTALLPSSSLEEAKSHSTEAAPPTGEARPNSEVERVAPSQTETPAVAAAQTSNEIPISKLSTELPSVLKDADYGEMWGVELKDASDIPTSIVLEKFLRANKHDLTKAKSQLIEALRWRKKMQPMKLLEDVEFDSSKFAGLGYVHHVTFSLMYLN